MVQLFPGVWQWSWFSQEKALDFNGLFLTVGEHRILIDPPPMTPEEMTLSRRGGPPDYILITNRDHSREAVAYQKEFGCQIYVPEADAPQMELKADRTYKDGALLPGGVWAIQLQDQKSPGESAFFIQQGKGILIVGDALVGREAGTLVMLKDDKYADVAKARNGLRRLLKYNFDTILVGDGTSIMQGAKPVVERALPS